MTNSVVAAEAAPAPTDEGKSKTTREENALKRVHLALFGVFAEKSDKGGDPYNSRQARHEPWSRKEYRR